jgi:hypothetical protein
LVLWPTTTSPEFIPGQGTVVDFRLIAEVGALDRPGFVPAHGLERALQVAHPILSGWAGRIAGLVAVSFPFYCIRSPQAGPKFDPTRRVWWLSADYRGELMSLGEE